MANIMINDTCNLRCPYCFANEFVNKQTNDITLDNFDKAVDFLLTSVGLKGSIGIIGGEPTLHPQFRRILQKLIEDSRIRTVVIFTNGTKLSEYMDLLANPKMKYLINLNSPEDIGQNQYNKTISNVRLLIAAGKKDDITLGLNIYSSNKDYSYFISALDYFGFPRARLSITVPNWEQEPLGFERFDEIKKTFYDIIIELMVRSISFVIDCNKPPRCVWTEEEKQMISLVGADKDRRRGLSLKENRCNPVIDIMPDLTAVRCFGMSDITKVNISDFASFDELRDYYLKQFDPQYSAIPSTDRCRDCELFDGRCYGGCLSNKKGRNQ